MSCSCGASWDFLEHEVTWPDLVTWPWTTWAEIFTQCVKKMCEKVCQKRRRCAPPFLRYRRKTGWGCPNTPPGPARVKIPKNVSSYCYGCLGAKYPGKWCNTNLSHLAPGERAIRRAPFHSHKRRIKQFIHVSRIQVQILPLTSAREHVTRGSRVLTFIS